MSKIIRELSIDVKVSLSEITQTAPCLFSTFIMQRMLQLSWPLHEPHPPSSSSLIMCHRTESGSVVVRRFFERHLNMHTAEGVPFVLPAVAQLILTLRNINITFSTRLVC